MRHRILRAAAAVAVVGLVAACAAPVSTPVASNRKAPAAAKPSAPVATPAPVASEAQHNEAEHIVVRPGQSVSRLAAEHGVSRAAIIDANHLTPPYKVKIGQRLLIPGAAVTPAEAPPTAPLAPVASEARHIVVQPGQSVSRLAVQYHVPKRAIIAANQLTPPYKVKIGQRLLIPGAAETPPPAVAAGSSLPEIIPADALPPAKSTASPPAAIAPVTAQPPAGVASADNNSPVAAEPLHAPVAPTPTPTPAPTPTGKPSAPSGPAAAPPEPAATTASAPPPAVVPAAAPPGVSCPPGTVGVTERDVIKMPVFVCHRLNPQE